MMNGTRIEEGQAQCDRSAEGRNETRSCQLHRRPWEWIQVKYEKLQERRQIRHYTSAAFSYLPDPMPVYDVLDQRPLELIILRLPIRITVICLSIFLVIPVLSPLFLASLIYGCGRLYCGLELSPLFQELWKLVPNVFQKIWEWIFARMLVKENKNNASKWKRKAAKFWWYIYLTLSPHSDFEANYMRAWDENATPVPTKKILIFVDDEVLPIPELPGDNSDTNRLKHLRIFYNLLQLRRGMSEVILARSLIRIDWVKVEEDSRVLGRRLQTMDLGRKAGTIVARFFDPNLTNNLESLKIEEEALNRSLQTGQNNRASIGIEFVRQYNRSALAGVVSIPSLGSLIFAIIWMAWYLIREHDLILNPQVIVATAFTVALYLVTAGTLGIATIAYLDLDKTGGDDDFVQWKEVDKAAKGDGISRKWKEVLNKAAKGDGVRRKSSIGTGPHGQLGVFQGPLPPVEEGRVRWSDEKYDG